MSGIGGWWGLPDASESTLERMLRATQAGMPTPARGTAPPVVRAATAALYGLDTPHAVILHQEDGIGVCLLGQVRFLGSDLAALAQTRGSGHALAQGWRKHGETLPELLGGAWALAIVAPEQAFLAIDRVGVHGMAWAETSGGIVFSTSVRAVAESVDAKLDPQGLYHYFYFNEVPSPGSIFQGIRKLGPGQSLSFSAGHARPRDYWKLAHDEARTPDFETEKHHFHRIYREAVARALDDAPAGCFLSGGTDSSSVVGMATEVTGKPADTYSIGFSADGFDEMVYARIATQRYGCNAHEYYLKSDDILEALPLIASAYDEPFANESAVPTFFCARMAAREGKRVMLAGDGGDEIFGGNERYAKQMVFERYHALPRALRGALEPLAFGIPGGDALMPLRKLRSYIRQANVPLPARLETYNFLTRQPLAELFAPEFLARVDTGLPHAWRQQVWDGADARHPVNRMMHLDLKFTLADNDLRKVTRMCEAAGVEVRYPLLDEAMVAFSGTLPPDWMVKDGYLRWFFKRALADFLPREIIDKKKHGFGLPFGIWARDHAPLRAHVETRMNAFSQRGILRADYVDFIRGEHMSGHATYYGRMVWMIVMLEEWLAARGL